MWSNWITLHFDWYSVDDMGFTYEVVSQESLKTEIQVQFDYPEYVSNFQFDKLIIQDGADQYVLQVPPQASKYLVFTEQVAFGLSLLICLSYFWYTVFLVVPWLRLLSKQNAS